LTQHGTVIPTALKIAAVRLVRKLEVEKSVYLMIPSLKDMTDHVDGLFSRRFKEVVRGLGAFSRQVNAARRSIEQDT